MREIDFLDAVGRIDDKFIEECITYRPQNRAVVWMRRAGAIAACLLIAVAAVLIVNYAKQPQIIDENGFYIENGVLLRYTGADTEVTLPDSVESVADFAFLENENAKEIRVVRLGASTKVVEANAFAGLEKLESVQISEKNEEFVTRDGLITSADGAVLLRYEREGETRFDMPDTVKIVAAHAVQISILEEIEFSENLEYIGYNAFAGCYGLKAIYLPDTVQYISDGAFAGCSSAVDGRIPEGAEIGQWAFDGVPFYLSMLAGQMCPAEEIERGLVTPSQAIVKSNQKAVTEQIEYILAAMRGDESYKETELGKLAYGAVFEMPKVPDGMTVPDEVSFSDLTFADQGWGGTGIYDLHIFLSAGDYTVVFEAYGYALYYEHYWEDAIFRIPRVYFIEDVEKIDPGYTVKSFGWTAVFERGDGVYNGITFMHEDGRIIRCPINIPSATPYILTFSPDGTRVAVEYDLRGMPTFYVQSLNGDVLSEPYYDYCQYLDNHNGQYVEKTLIWVDNDTIEGENVYGRFRFNIYGYQAEIIEPKDGDDMMLDGYDHVTVDPSLSEQVNGLPFDGDKAKMKFTLVGGSPTIYVPSGKELCFYIRYEGKPVTIYESIFNLPNGYENGEIIYASGGGGSGEYFMFVSAELQGRKVLLAYYFYSGGAPQPDEVIIMEGEWKTSIEELAYGLPDGSDPAALTSILSMTVSEIERLYGKLTLEYSEHGPGQPVYSMAHLSGVNLVFRGHEMNEPLKADMKPSEIILTEEYGRKYHGLAVRDYVELTDISWESAEYSVIDGTVMLSADFDTYRISCAVATRWENIPDDTAPQSEWDVWKAKFLGDPRGEIRQLRIELIK